MLARLPLGLLSATSLVFLTGCISRETSETAGTAFSEFAPPLPSVQVVNVLEPKGESNVRSSFRLGSQTYLIGTEETADVYKTTDGGRTWKKTFDAGNAFPKTQDIRKIIRSSEGSLYASTSGKGHILKSTDEGETWSLVNSIPAWRTVGIIQLDDGTYLTGARKDDSGRTTVYRSTDGFETLEPIYLDTPEQQNVTVFHDLGGGHALAGIGYDGTAKLFKSMDSGRTWRMVADFAGSSDIFDFIEIDGTLYTTTKSTSAIYRSTDKGETWTLHTQIWDKGFIGEFGELEWNGRTYYLLCGADQRDPDLFRHVVLISDDNGRSWQEWIELQQDNTGAASNLTVDGTTIIVGAGNHSAQGRAFVLHVSE